jgi:hypothetical protein
MGVHGDAGASGRAKSLVARVWGGTAEDERCIHRQLRTLRSSAARRIQAAYLKQPDGIKQFVLFIHSFPSPSQ